MCAVVAATRDSGAERQAHDALVTLADVATAARAEFSPSEGTTAWLHRARHVADLGWALLGARTRGDEALDRSLARRITDDLGG